MRIVCRVMLVFLVFLVSSFVGSDVPHQTVSDPNAHYSQIVDLILERSYFAKNDSVWKAELKRCFKDHANGNIPITQKDINSMGNKESYVIKKCFKEDIRGAYFTPEAYAEFLYDMSGEVEGIGIIIRSRKSGGYTEAYVEALLPGGPASKSGIIPGDRIIAIGQYGLGGVGLLFSFENDQLDKEKGILIKKVLPLGAAALSGKIVLGDRIVAVASHSNKFQDVKTLPPETFLGTLFGTVGERIGLRVRHADGTIEEVFLHRTEQITVVKDMTPQEVMRNIRGKAGTKVVLHIQRKGTNHFKIILERAVVPVHYVSAAIFEDKNGLIGYVKISKFEGEFVKKDLSPALERFEREGVAKKIILDLRGNPGGRMYLAHQMLHLFLKKTGKPYLVLDYRTNKESTILNKNGKYSDWKIAVLVDGGSASASEIVGGVLQEQGWKLFGEKTYGKGSVQEVIKLKNNGGFKVTRAIYRLANGKTPEDGGLLPDFPVANPENTKFGSPEDAQLKKAIEYLSDL